MRKIKFKLNIFDVVIIVLVLAAGLFAYRVMNADRGGGTILSSGKNVTVRYTLELSNLQPGIAAMIKPGDSVVEVVEKRAIGTVVSCEIKPYRITSQNQITGETILTDVPDREFAILTVELNAVETESAITANGFDLRGGTNLSVTGPGWAGPGLIIDIERAA